MAAEPLKSQWLEAANRFPGGGILQARERRLRGQRPAALTRHRAQGRVVAQEARVVGILVAGCDLVDALAHKLKRRVRDLARIALIPKPLSQRGRESQALVKLAQQYQPRLAGDLATLEVDRQFGLESQPESGTTLCSYRHLPPPSADAALAGASIAQFGSVGGFLIQKFVNNPG